MEVKEHLLEVNSLSSSTYMSLRNSAQVLRLGNKGLQLLSNLVSIQFEKDLFTYYVYLCRCAQKPEEGVCCLPLFPPISLRQCLSMNLGLEIYQLSWKPASLNNPFISIQLPLKVRLQKCLKCQAYYMCTEMQTWFEVMVQHRGKFLCQFQTHCVAKGYIELLFLLSYFTLKLLGSLVFVCIFKLKLLIFEKL